MVNKAISHIGWTRGLKIFMNDRSLEIREKSNKIEFEYNSKKEVAVSDD